VNYIEGEEKEISPLLDQQRHKDALYLLVAVGGLHKKVDQVKQNS
jgi:hypothetical protein